MKMNLIDIPLEDKLNLSNDDLSESSPSQDLDNSIIISVDEVMIVAGETLGDIAREQGVSIDEIRRENISLEGLSDDNLESLVGTKLRIPRGL